MEPQAGRTLSPIHTTKRSDGFLRKTTRRSRVHLQTIGLNAGAQKCRHRAAAALCLLTFPFIGLVRFALPIQTVDATPSGIKLFFKGGVYEARQTVRAFRGAEDRCVESLEGGPDAA